MGLLRAMATVGGWTAASRVLGFARDILIARALGTGWVADAWVVAFRLPNLFRRLLGEGAFNAAFVPLFARRLEEEGTAAAKAFAEQSLSVLLATSLLLTALAMAAMPWLMPVLAPGFLDHPEQFALSVWMARIAFPYLLFMALTALFSGVLNSLRRYSAAAAAPVLLNMVLILALLLAAPLAWPAGPTLAWAVALAGLLQFLLLLVAARRAGMALRLPRPRLTPGVRRLLRLMVPGMLAAGALQLNLFVGTLVATLQEGVPSYLYYADRVYQLPLGLIGIALAVVLLPEITRRLRSEGEAAAETSMNHGLEFALFLTLPATVALLVIPLPIVRTLFERGAFDSEASVATALSLLAYAAGLPAYVLAKVFQTAFFAREDTVTPLRAALWGVGANLVLAVGLFFALRPFALGHLGLAAASSFAAWLSLILLAIVLRRRGHFRVSQRLRERVPRQAAAALLMGAALFGLNRLLADWLLGEEWQRFAALALLVLAGILVYLAAALAFGALPKSQLAKLGERLRRRRAKAGEEKR
jgi:putative peptidoglycan lipid II flippase